MPVHSPPLVRPLARSARSEVAGIAPRPVISDGWPPGRGARHRHFQVAISRYTIRTGLSADTGQVALAPSRADRLPEARSKLTQCQAHQRFLEEPGKYRRSRT